jgi:hypothetical protein
VRRIDGPTATNDSKFTHGNPQQGVAATRVKAEWLNAVQEEIANVIEAAGIELDPEDDAQLVAALETLFVRRFTGAITEGVPVSVNDTITELLPADVTRRAFYARNVGDSAVALVAAGGTFAAAAIYVLPGEIWRETIAPGAQWFCICDVAGEATMNLLVKS